MDNNVLLALGALVPSVGVGLIFWFVMRSILRADRRERAALERFDAEQAARESTVAVGDRERPAPAELG